MAKKYSLKQLIKASEKTVVTKDGAKKLNKRLAKAEKLFEEKDEQKNNFPPGFLDREFTL